MRVEMQIVSEKERTPSAKFLHKREQILERAAEKFNLLGVRGATLADIAVSVGLNLTSIRHYFLKKEDLVAAAFHRSIQVHGDRLEKSKRIGPPEARCARSGAPLFRVPAAHPRGRGAGGDPFRRPSLADGLARRRRLAEICRPVPQRARDRRRQGRDRGRAPARERPRPHHDLAVHARRVLAYRLRGGGLRPRRGAVRQHPDQWPRGAGF